MRNFFLFILSFLFLPSLIAQNEKPQIEKVPDTEIIEEVEEMPVFEDTAIEEDYNSNYTKTHNSKYNTQKIYDDYEWFYDKNNSSYSKKYGILKKGKVLLPMIFSASTYGNPGKKSYILGVESTYGLFNLENQQWAIPIIYEQLRMLNKNLYSAKLNGKTGIVDEYNHAITDFKWSEISTISDLSNYFIVKNFSKPTYLRGIYSITNKKMVIPCKYTRIAKMSNENYFSVTDGLKHNIIDINDKPRFKIWYDQLNIVKGGRKLYIVKKDGKMGIINEKEEAIVPIEYQLIETYPYQDGSYLARNKDGKYGFITANGTITLPFVYDQLTKSNYNKMITAKNDKCGILQINNGVPYEIATCDYDEITRGEKVFVVAKNKQFGLMDFYGKMITELDYDIIEYLSSNIYVAKKRKDWFILNNNGEIINKKPFRYIEKIMSKNSQNGYYSRSNFSYLKVQNSKKKYGIVDKLGNEVIAPMFDDILSETKNIVLVKNKSKFGLYNLLQKTMILPSEYDQLVFEKRGYYGFKGNDIYFISIVGGKVVVKKIKE